MKMPKIPISIGIDEVAQDLSDKLNKLSDDFKLIASEAVKKYSETTLKAVRRVQHSISLMELMNTLNISDDDLTSGEPIHMQISPEELSAIGELYKLSGIDKLTVTAVLRLGEPEVIVTGEEQER
jgi:hypothetical protein